jgi:hypothetical protein
MVNGCIKWFYKGLAIAPSSIMQEETQKYVKKRTQQLNKL